MAPFRIERYVVKSFLDAMKSILDKVTYIVGCFAGLLIFCCGMMIAYEVVCRSVFNAPTEWVMELATYCVTVAGFLGMSVTYAAKKHIHVDLLLTKLSKSTCDKLEIVTTLVGAFYSFIFMRVLRWLCCPMSSITALPPLCKRRCGFPNPLCRLVWVFCSCI